MGAKRKRGIDGEAGGILVLKIILQSRGRERQLRISARYCRFGKDRMERRTLTLKEQLYCIWKR
jgi:hypothetical protein